MTDYLVLSLASKLESEQEKQQMYKIYCFYTSPVFIKIYNIYKYFTKSHRRQLITIEKGRGFWNRCVFSPQPKFEEFSKPCQNYIDRQVESAGPSCDSLKCS